MNLVERPSNRVESQLRTRQKTASLTEHVGSDGNSEVRVAAQNVQRVSVCRLLEALVVYFQYLPAPSTMHINTVTTILNSYAGASCELSDRTEKIIILKKSQG